MFNNSFSGTTLADMLRPERLDDMVGQARLFGKNGLIRTLLERGHVRNMVLYGPPGTGKSTCANIIAKTAGKSFYKLNATSAGLSDIKEVIEKTNTLEAVGGGILLYLDEIQYFNKKQQQSLLEYIEDGRITLIAATTENPYFYIYGALLSRCNVFEFSQITAEDIVIMLNRGIDRLCSMTGEKKSAESGALELLARTSGGDMRRALNKLELAFLSERENIITLEKISTLSDKASLRHDRDGDEHYNLLSALHKSLRGSDENAALHYLARLLEGGDIISASRRILCVACEDVGLAYPSAALIVKSLIDIAERLGLPEARLPLSEAVIFLATCPKSNSATLAIDKAITDIRSGAASEAVVPLHLSDTSYDGAEKLGKGGYIYPHDYPSHYVDQQYMPEKLMGRVYYKFGDNKNERAAYEYRQNILKESN